MFDDERLKQLEEEQRMLVIQSDLERTSIVYEVAALKERLGWVSGAAESAKQNRGWVYGAAAAAGLLAFRYRSTVTKWLPIALTIWKTARVFIRR